MGRDSAAKRTLTRLLTDVRACRVCEAHLPLGPRPIVRATASATVVIVGQAPGTRVHETGVPWDDPSGDRLREWMAVDREAFYDETRIAFLPMGFCYPGRDPKGGDRPPRPECAPLWHPLLMPMLPRVKLVLLVGQYAQRYYLPGVVPVAERVREFRAAPKGMFPLPHPSWRVNGWLRRNPWFARNVLPELRRRLRALL